MTALTSLGLFIFAVIVYSIQELHAHGKLKWMGEEESFWGEHSDRRKYRQTNPEGWVIDAPDTWYYRFFKLKYKEAFPGSATIFVIFTDGYHLMQFLFKLFLIASLVTYKEMVNPWVDGLIYFWIWQLVFNVVYKELSK